jgi:hypothetical protein
VMNATLSLLIRIGFGNVVYSLGIVVTAVSLNGFQILNSNSGDLDYFSILWSDTRRGLLFVWPYFAIALTSILLALFRAPADRILWRNLMYVAAFFALLLEIGISTRSTLIVLCTISVCIVIDLLSFKHVVGRLT